MGAVGTRESCSYHMFTLLRLQQRKRMNGISVLQAGYTNHDAVAYQLKHGVTNLTLSTPCTYLQAMICIDNQSVRKW